MPLNDDEISANHSETQIIVQSLNDQRQLVPVFLHKTIQCSLLMGKWRSAYDY